MWVWGITPGSSTRVTRKCSCHLSHLSSSCSTIIFFFGDRLRWLVTNWLDRIQNHRGGMPVRSYFKYVNDVGRSTHCGWFHSLAGILDCTQGERQLSSSVHSSFSASGLDVSSHFSLNFPITRDCSLDHEPEESLFPWGCFWQVCLFVCFHSNEKKEDKGIAYLAVA